MSFGCGPNSDDIASRLASREVDRTQRFPGVDQQRKNVTPTGVAPGYRVRRVKELPPQGQNMDFVWSDADQSICVWVDDRWICFGTIGGGADCMFDYLVSPCWAELVALGGFTEGMTLFSITGCPFIVYSTMQPAIDHANAENEEKIIFLCDGVSENLNLPTTLTHGLEIVGAGRDKVRITPSSGDALTVLHGVVASNHKVTIRHVTFDGEDYGLRLGNGGSGDVIDFWDCLVIGDTGGCIVAGSPFSKLRFMDCDIEAIIIAGTADGSLNSAIENLEIHGGSLGGFDFQATGNAANQNKIHIGKDVRLTGVYRFPPCNDLYMGGRFDLSAPATRVVQLVRASAAVNEFKRVHLDFIGPELTGQTVAARGIEIGEAANGCHIQDFRDDTLWPYPTNTTNAVNFIKLLNNSSINGGKLGATYPIEDGTGNCLEQNTAWKSIDAPSPAGISNTKFDCSPPGFEFDAGVGTGNSVSQWQFGEGSPTHFANGGQRYWDITNKVNWYNLGAKNVPSNLWASSGVSGGGLAAPVSHGHPYAYAGEDDEEDFEPFLIPGPAGLPGPTGATGPPGTGGGGTAMPLPDLVDPDLFGEALSWVPGPEYIAKYFDAVVDAQGGRTTAGVQIYSKLVDAIAAGHRSIFLRGTTGDTATITIAAGDVVKRIVGQDAQTTFIPVDVQCDKSDVLFESVTFFDGVNGRKLTLNGARDVVFATLFTGSVIDVTATLNDGTGINSTDLTMDYDGSSTEFPAAGIAVIGDEVFGYESGGAAAAGTLVITSVNLRGTMDSLEQSHSDNDVITSLYTAHLAITAADCQVVQCRFILCLNNLSSCIRVGLGGLRARLISNVYLLNNVYSVITFSPETDASNGAAAGVQIVGSTFDTNTITEFEITQFHTHISATAGPIFSLGVAGNLFRNYQSGCLMIHGGFWNISGNAFDGTAQNTRGAQINDASDINATDTVIDFDAETGTGVFPRKGVILIDTEFIIYSSKSATQFLGCIRGALGTTAAIHLNNATISNLSQRTFYNLQIGNSASNQRYHLLTGNSIANVNVVLISVGGNVNHFRLMFADNAINACLKLYSEESCLWFNNAIDVGSFDFRSKTGQVMFGGRLRNASVQNVASDTFLFVPIISNVTGIPTSLVIPTARILALGRAAADVSQIAVPLTNKSGANSVVGHAAAVDNATADAWTNAPGAASPRGIGVVVEGGIADGSPTLIALYGRVTVLLETAGVVALGDLLEFSATAGALRAAAAPVHGGIVAKATQAKAAATAGSGRCVLVSG